MHYTGTIDASSKTGEAGKKFDSSRDRGNTFDFTIGQGQVIKGWDQGIVGLCLGARATLILPPDLGYGEKGAGGDIPGGATLNFDIEVVDIKDAPPQPNIFKEIDADSDGKLTKDEVQGWFKEKQKSDMPAELWGKEDADGNGHITWEEFSGPKGKKDEL
jgi:FK506-binding protein 14